jgi:hypothetical protein
VRRLVAGELEGTERARTEEHVAGCTRCQAARGEVEAENRAVRAALPFETFAAGVAERLARGERAAPARRSIARLRWPLALAAALLAVAAAPLVARLARPPSDDVVRLKGGGPALSVYVDEAGAGRAMARGEPVRSGARLRVGLAPGGRRHAAVLLVDGDGAALVYAGAAAMGPLPGAFEWTGAGDGTVVAVLADAPIDAEALRARVARGGPGAAAEPGATVVTWPLRRARP